jgi:hypothetical protein
MDTPLAITRNCSASGRHLQGAGQEREAEKIEMLRFGGPAGVRSEIGNYKCDTENAIALLNTWTPGMRRFAFDSCCLAPMQQKNLWQSEIAGWPLAPPRLAPAVQLLVTLCCALDFLAAALHVFACALHGVATCRESRQK